MISIPASGSRTSRRGSSGSGVPREGRTMPPELARDLSRLCRAGRYAASATPALIVAFTRAVWSHGSVGPDELLALLEGAGISERAWRVAADVMMPRTPFWAGRRQAI